LRTAEIEGAVPYVFYCNIMYSWLN